MAFITRWCPSYHLSWVLRRDVSHLHYVSLAVGHFILKTTHLWTRFVCLTQYRYNPTYRSWLEFYHTSACMLGGSYLLSRSRGDHYDVIFPRVGAKSDRICWCSAYFFDSWYLKTFSSWKRDISSSTGVDRKIQFASRRQQRSRLCGKELPEFDELLGGLRSSFDFLVS